MSHFRALIALAGIAVAFGAWVNVLRALPDSAMPWAGTCFAGVAVAIWGVWGMPR